MVTPVHDTARAVRDAILTDAVVLPQAHPAAPPGEGRPRMGAIFGTSKNSNQVAIDMGIVDCGCCSFHQLIDGPPIDAHVVALM